MTISCRISSSRRDAGSVAARSIHRANGRINCMSSAEDMQSRPHFIPRTLSPCHEAGKFIEAPTGGVRIAAEPFRRYLLRDPNRLKSKE